MKLPSMLLPIVGVAALIGASPMSASLIVSIPSVTASPGSSGNFFDVTLTNTGPLAVTIAGFGVGVSTANPDIFLTAATWDTSAPYIFLSSSLLGPDLLGSTTGLSLTAGDVSLFDRSVAPGATVGLARVFFDVAPNAGLGSFTVTLDPIATSLADSTGADIPITALQDGTITTAVPEPGSFYFLGGALLVMLGAAGRRKRPV